MENPFFISTVDVARIAGVSRKTPLNAAHDGDIPRPMRVGHSFAWLRSEMPAILAGLKRRAERSNDPAPAARLADQLAGAA